MGAAAYAAIVLSVSILSVHASDEAFEADMHGRTYDNVNYGNPAPDDVL